MLLYIRRFFSEWSQTRIRYKIYERPGRRATYAFAVCTTPTYMNTSESCKATQHTCAADTGMNAMRSNGTERYSDCCRPFLLWLSQRVVLLRWGYICLLIEQFILLHLNWNFYLAQIHDIKYILISPIWRGGAKGDVAHLIILMFLYVP